MVESWASNAGRRRIMQGNRGRDTRPELAVRRLLHARGLRYRVNFRPEKDLRRTADLVFTRAKVAVFIDGCYWHGCPDHYIPPATNPGYWSNKVSTNRNRDAHTNQTLRERGWTVLRFWEHETPETVAESIERNVRAPRNYTRPPATPAS
jgi:DNA mismatch endonuclease, patch repair protein